MRSSLILLVVFVAASAHALIPGNKRTILTSGEKVYPIRYQLGQSTVLDLGVKPDVVICGNKNYFNIEKLKNGITIQPLSNFSTNLTVLSGQRRFLFYLTPAGGQNPDGFIDVRWVPENEKKIISHSSPKTDVQFDLNQKMKITSDLEITFVRVNVSSDRSRKIFDLSVRNSGPDEVGTNAIGIMAYENGQVVKNQALVWEKEALTKNSTLKGRLVVTKTKGKSFSALLRFRGKSLKLTLKGVVN